MDLTHHTTREITRPEDTRPYYCTDCDITLVHSRGSMCTACSDEFMNWLKWEDYYEAQDQISLDSLESIIREHNYRDTLPYVPFKII